MTAGAAAERPELATAGDEHVIVAGIDATPRWEPDPTTIATPGSVLFVAATRAGLARLSASAASDGEAVRAPDRAVALA